MSDDTVSTTSSVLSVPVEHTETAKPKRKYIRKPKMDAATLIKSVDEPAEVPAAVQPDPVDPADVEEEVLKNERVSISEAVPAIQTSTVTDEDAIEAANEPVPQAPIVEAEAASTKARKKRTLTEGDAKPRAKKVKVEEPITAAQPLEESPFRDVSHEDVPVHEPRVRRKLVVKKPVDIEERRIRKNVGQSVAKTLMNDNDDKVLARIAPIQSQVIMKQATQAKTAEQTSQLLGLRPGELKRNKQLLTRVHGH